MLYPISEKSSIIRLAAFPSFNCNKPGTFSKTTALGLRRLAVSTIAKYNRFLSSLTSRGPASENPWHGGPPTNTSTFFLFSFKNSEILSMLLKSNKSNFNTSEFP